MRQARQARILSQSISRVEILEGRTLFALGAPIAQQPIGSLTGKIVYTHAGHGSTSDYPGDGKFDTQRGEGFEMVEDFGNQDQMTAYVNYLFRAGATIVPLRPVGHQTNEVIVDNDSAGFSIVSGSWSNGSSNPYFALSSAVPTARYRSTTSSTTETAVARFTPNIPAAGMYPVYGWALDGANRAPDQTYRINYTGGSIEVKVNHQRVGKGWIYLGTYYFAAGTGANVEVSNKTAVGGSAIIADAIRFGNGIGDIDRGAGRSGLSREDEAGIYWMRRMAGYNLSGSTVTEVDDSNWYGSSNDRDSTVSSSPRYSAYMNNASNGTIADRVFISYHSNAAGSGGTLALLNGNNRLSARTPNQVLLANTMGVEVNDDMVAQNGTYEHNWVNDPTPTLDRSDIEFGEINNEVIGDEFDATIIEVAYHDFQNDAELMRDPKVRNAVARATVQGTIRFFNGLNASNPLVMPPDMPTLVRALSDNAGNVTISWTSPGSGAVVGDAPTGYRIYTSSNGYGFDGGILVNGGASSSYTIPANLLDNSAVYFRVASVNSGGESPLSPVVASRKSLTGKAQVLIVNGFDRYDRSGNFRQTVDIIDTSINNYVSPVTIDRVRYDYNNAFNYVVRAGEAIESFASQTIGFDTTDFRNIGTAAVNLANYQAVVWLSGENSTANRTFTATMQSAVINFVTAGGKLFVSGSEVGWDLVANGGGSSFFTNTLKSTYVSDDAGVYAATGSAGSIFAGISLGFSNGTDEVNYDVDYPDVLSPAGGSTLAMNYSGGSSGAATQWSSGNARVVMMGFPFESITTVANQNAVMAAVLNFFNVDVTAPVVNSATFNYLTNQNVSYVFSESVIGSLTTADISVVQLPATGIPQGQLILNFNGGQTSPTLSFASTLADGNYRVTINASGVTDAGGNPLQTNHMLDFFVLAADANRDRKVNTLDFNILSGNFGQPGRNFAQGDFNYSTNVDSIDFNVLTGNYGKTLPAPASMLMAASASVVAPSPNLFGTFSGEAVRDWVDLL